MNLHVLAIGQNSDDLHRIGRSIAELGVEIEDEVLVQNESDVPYTPFGPDDQPRKPPTDFINLAGDSEVTEVTVRTNAPIADLTLQDAGRQDLLADDILIITIERDGTVITPHGETEIRADDVVTVFAQTGIEDGTLDAFLGDKTS